MGNLTLHSDYVGLPSTEFLAVDPEQFRELGIRQPDRYDPIGSIQQAVSCPYLAGMELAFDTFRGEIVYTRETSKDYRTRAWFSFEDHRFLELRMRLTNQNILREWALKSLSEKDIKAAVYFRAMENPIDLAKVWLDSLEWDGVKRVDTFLETYFGAVGNKETLTAYSRYLWTALAGRVMDPGCKADMMLVAYGAQGAGKSSSIKAIAPAKEYFTELSFHEKDADKVRKLRGVLIAEYAEMAGLRNRELESVKGFISTSSDKLIQKFKEFSSTYDRRCVFFGSTNEDQFLEDSTGNRRFLPFEAGNCDSEGIEEDRDNLWAEALTIWLKSGIQWQDAQRLAPEEHKQYRTSDIWQSPVSNWLEAEDSFTGVANKDREQLTSADILSGALGMQVAQFTDAAAKRVAKVMRNLGYEHGFSKTEGKSTRVWRLDTRADTPRKPSQ